MLTREENELVTRVGPGTPMGETLRRYWMPALLTKDLPEPDCPPVRVRRLGEDLVAFRDSEGRIGLLDEYCAHRCASLFLGRNEESGLRCVYHGWKYDVFGNCVDMPNEPPESRFKEKVRLTAYPAVETGGVVWTYMGPPEKQPALPDMEWMRVPPSHRFVSKTLEECNYLQAIEGGIDTSHISFLHNNNLSDKQSLARRDTAPRLELERTEYGFCYAGIRTAGEQHYVRIYQFVLPFYQMRPAGFVRGGAGGNGGMPTIKGHMWAPIDDVNTCVFNWIYSADLDRPLTPELILEEETTAGRGPDGETFTRRRTRANNWLIDRALQRTKTFTGIEGLNTQDLAVQESMGFIVDRSREHLGAADQAVIAMRRLMLAAVREVREGGDPPGLDPTTYRGVRSTEVLIPKDARWQDAAAEALLARA